MKQINSSARRQLATEQLNGPAPGIGASKKSSSPSRPKICLKKSSRSSGWTAEPPLSRVGVWRSTIAPEDVAARVPRQAEAPRRLLTRRRSKICRWGRPPLHLCGCHSRLYSKNHKGPVFSRNSRPIFAQYISERPEMTSYDESQRKANKQQKEIKYEKSEH